jgi:ubiquitin related modifier 1
MVSFSVELGGGLDLLFARRKRIPLEVAGGASTSVRAVIALLRAQLTERPELFAAGDSVRPGILVLNNEVDWELEGMLYAEVKEGCVG